MFSEFKPRKVGAKGAGYLVLEEIEAGKTGNVGGNDCRQASFHPLAPSLRGMPAKI